MSPLGSNKTSFDVKLIAPSAVQNQMQVAGPQYLS